MIEQEQSQIDDSALVKALIAPVQHAGRVIMDFYQTDPSAETKADGSPVTKADQAAEAILACRNCRFGTDNPDYFRRKCRQP
jgi:fructose-1,6-bisphosphatase/inositol monophosphatase family enzyme